MILVVDEALFEDKSVRDTDRVALLRLIALRDHGMLVQATPHPRGVASTPDALERWRAGIGGSLNSEVTQLVLHTRNHMPVDGTARAGPRIVVSNRWNQRPDYVLLSLEEAIRVLGEPLHILVENGLRDAAFLRRILPEHWRVQLDGWEASGRVRFEHGGGLDEMRTIVDFMLEGDGARRSWGVPARAWALLHFLVFDHDGDTSGQCSASARDMQTLCAGSPLADRYHMLERRCQEYYLPREAMEWIVNRSVTNPADRNQMLAYLRDFFAGNRTHGALPKMGARSDFWKGRFWNHRNDEWRKEWFAADGSGAEAQQVAEAIQRCL